MSIALDRLGADDRRVIAEELLVNPRPFKSEELTAHCPFHVESTPGGAFFYNFEKDLAYCHSCGQDSDLVGIFNATHGRDADDSDGCRDFVKKYCPDAGGRKPISRGMRRKSQESWAPPSTTLPPALWIQKASTFVEHSIERLQNNEEQLAELASCGISADVARLCRFGWNEKDKWPPLSAWGLPSEKNDQGKEKKIWLPTGLVMPAIRGGQVVKLKIRRPDPKTPWGDVRKYWEVKGGANSLFHVYGRPTCRIWILVETERDAAMLWAHCHKMGVGAIGAGGAAKRPCEDVATLLRRAKVVLNALDYDQAGAANTYKFWEEEFPNSIRYPAPPSMGKDVGDAYRRGLDVRQWVWDGLPQYAQRFLQQRTDKSQEAAAASQEPAAEHETAAGEPTIDQVLEWMAPWPMWKQRLSNFYGEMRGTGFRVFKGRKGEIWMGLSDHNYGALRGDDQRRELFVRLRSELFEDMVLDHELGSNSLANIINHYFGDYLEVC